MANFAQAPYLVALLESFPMGVIAADGEGHLRAANSAMRELVRAGEDTEALGGGFGEAVRCINAVLGPEGCGRSTA